MRAAAALCLAAAAAAPAPAPSFDTWAASLGRAFASPAERAARRAVFEANMAAAAAHNARGAPYTLGASPFADLTAAEWRARVRGGAGARGARAAAPAAPAAPSAPPPPPAAN